MHPATKAAKAAPDSNLNRWLPYAIHDFVGFTAFINSINEGDLRSFWGRRKSLFVSRKHDLAD